MRGSADRVHLLLRALALSLLAVAAAARAEDRPAVVVTNPNEHTFKAAVQEFAPGAPGLDVAHFRQDLVDALDFSGIFTSIDPGAFLGPKRTASLGSEPAITCPDWAQIGADALVQGETSAAAGGIAVDFLVWDVPRCRTPLRKRYTGSASDSRRIAKRVADDVVAAFTGKPGVASTELTFISSRSGSQEVWVMDADGGNQRQATRNRAINAFPSWTPDGSSILYMSYQYLRSPHLFRLVRSGSERPGRLFESLDSKAAVYRGVPDPSGQRIAAVVSVDGAPEIFVVDADGRNPRRLTHDPAIDVSPTWSPDGKRIAFVSDRAGSPNIYVMNDDGSNVKRLTFDGGYNAAPAWSPDGRWIAYEVRVGGQFDIWLIDPEGQTNAPLVTHPKSDENPTWAPDGRKLAFASTRRGRSDIYSIDVDGENLRRLTDGAGDNKMPSWGPYPR
ncbi:MAG TPA: DPP IV N-terminal domain-containing protein [Myxococcota bacterium]|nr:DPP IV N-terminal domain-containing protein [Myxococcota bacterium]